MKAFSEEPWRVVAKYLMVLYNGLIKAKTFVAPSGIEYRPAILLTFILNTRLSRRVVKRILKLW